MTSAHERFGDLSQLTKKVNLYEKLFFRSTFYYYICMRDSSVGSGLSHPKHWPENLTTTEVCLKVKAPPLQKSPLLSSLVLELTGETGCVPVY